MTPYLSLLDAIELARIAHQGQVDKQGRDYFTDHLEPIAEALRAQGEQGMMAGYLHDVVEDCGPDYSLDALLAMGVHPEVVSAVDSVTRRADETYADLIGRACSDPLGVFVKLADNTHNILSNPGLAQTDPERAMSMLAHRYLPARDRLIAAIAARATAEVTEARALRAEAAVAQARQWISTCVDPVVVGGAAKQQMLDTLHERNFEAHRD